MIVFYDDWRKYPGAIPDTKTRNKSFLKIAKLFKDLGVKNYYFHLALLQPELQGVDPHDEENLTIKQKAMILWECDNNPWYYLREMVLDKKAGNEIVETMYKAHRGNIAAMWLLLACIDYIQIQPRQTGKSYGADCNSSWLLYYCYENTQLNLITKDDTTRVSNIKRLKDIRDSIPKYAMRHGKGDDNNQHSLSCRARNNKFVSHVAQSSDKGANNLGRGLTSPYVDIDEGPFITHIETTVSSAMGAMNTAKENAKRSGKPYCTVFTTTAGNPADRDGKYMFNIWNNAAPWHEAFLDAKNREELVKLIKANKHGLDLTVNLTFSALQLGKTEEWLLDAIASARSEGANIDRDYFNRWTSGNDDGLIPTKTAARVREGEMNPIRTEISDNGFIFKWYEDYDPNEMYVFSVDTSDAIGRDDIAVTLINSSTGATAAAGFFNELNLMNFAYWLKDMLLKYKNTILNIERQYNAQVIIDILILKLVEVGEDPFKRIFNRIVQERDLKPDLFYKVVQPGLNRNQYYYDQYKDSFGFKTNAESRRQLYGSVLFKALENVAEKVRDGKLIAQMLSLIIKNGRVDHAAGSHDDMVIAWLLGHWTLQHGMSLSHYGFDPNKILKTKKVESKDAKEASIDREQNRIKSRIAEISEKLKEKLELIEVLKLETELRILMTKVIAQDDVDMTLDAIIDAGKKSRRGNYGTESKIRSAKALLR